MEMEVNNVFVYGTLRKKDFRNGALGECKQVLPKAFLEGHQMLHLGGFPGIIPGEGRILGEVYDIDEDVLKVLDRIEGYNESRAGHNLYNREVVDVVNDEGEAECRAYVYIYNTDGRDLDGLEVIETGDWLNQE